MEPGTTENQSQIDHAPMTPAQRSCLETLSREAGEEFDEHEVLSATQAALRIEDLRRQVRWMVARQPILSQEIAGL